jgi:hypothetical protein
MVAALQGFSQTSSNALIATFVVGVLFGSVLSLSAGMMAIVILSWLLPTFRTPSSRISIYRTI